MTTKTSGTLPLGPARLDLTGIRAGDQNMMAVSIRSGGVPLDLTGRTVTAQARRFATSVEAMDAVVEVTDAATGQVTVRWPGESVATLLGDSGSVRGVWDLQVASPGGDPITILAGQITCEMDVTR